MGARKPDGSSARTERVSFTRPAAERIAKVVRLIEQGDRTSRGPSWDALSDNSGRSSKTFRICTFTGSWSIGTPKIVTFKYQTATPNTMSATNLFWPVPDGSERDCAIARDGTAWFLVTPQMYAANAAVDATLTTSAIEFTTLPVAALATASTATFSISITTCSTAAV